MRNKLQEKSTATNIRGLVLLRCAYVAEDIRAKERMTKSAHRVTRRPTAKAGNWVIARPADATRLTNRPGDSPASLRRPRPFSPERSSPAQLDTRLTQSRRRGSGNAAKRSAPLGFSSSQLIACAVPVQTQRRPRYAPVGMVSPQVPGVRSKFH